THLLVGLVPGTRLGRAARGGAVSALLVRSLRRPRPSPLPAVHRAAASLPGAAGRADGPVDGLPGGIAGPAGARPRDGRGAPPPDAGRHALRGRRAARAGRRPFVSALRAERSRLPVPGLPAGR